MTKPNWENDHTTTIINNHPVIFLSLLVDTGIVKPLFVSPDSESLFGIRADDLVGNFDLLIDCFEFPQLFREQFRQCQLDGKVFSFEGWAQSRMGDRRYWVFLAEPIPDGMWMAMLRDFTSLQETLIKNQQLQLLIDSMDDIIFSLDTEMKHTGVYGRWLKNFNLSPDFFLGKTAVDIMGEREAKIHIESAQQALQGQMVTYEWGDRANQYFVTTLSPIFDQNNEVISLVGIGKDITARAQATEALRQSEHLLSQMAHLIPDFVYLYDLESRQLTFTNRNLATFLNLSETGDNQTIGQRIIDHADRAQSEKRRHAILELHNAPLGTVITNELEIRLPDHPIYHLQVRDTVFAHNENGTTRVLLGMIQDITVQKRIAQRNHELELEKERIQILNRFMQAASHEFRTPLSIINTSNYLMSKSNDEDIRLRKSKQIEEQVIRLERLVAMIIKQTQLDSNVPFNIAPVNPIEFMNTIRALQKSHAENRQVQIEVHNISPVNYPLKIDEGWMREALIEIVRNAIDYSYPHTQVHLHLRQVETETIIAVEDFGRGIPDHALPHIFERFFRLDSAHNSIGIGLGLNIAQSIIERHHGTLLVTSSEGYGSTFTISIPH